MSSFKSSKKSKSVKTDLDKKFTSFSLFSTLYFTKQLMIKPDINPKIAPKPIVINSPAHYKPAIWEYVLLSRAGVLVSLVAITIEQTIKPRMGMKMRNKIGR